ncbi:MAG: carboxypeptidase regulatory-like domain-containing protein [Gemmatimonadaceae bacterium]|nr:carboxypeptidase regulatory-like domain-containing protein [Gemmatimonadaceae bacterium]
MHTVRNLPIRTVATMLFALMALHGIGAQTSRPQPRNTGAITGTVVDTNGVPIAEVTVTLVKTQRRTLTGVDGSFRFDSIPLGTHEVSARGVGLIGGVQRVTVGPNGGSVTIVMIRFSTSLPSMVTVATQGGLSGVIGDTAYHALAGVVITAVGGSQIAKTDSTGAFAMPLKPGRYLIRLERDGYLRQTMGVTIPETEGRRIAAWLAPQEGAPNHAEAQNMFDLGQRMIHLSHVSAKFYSREDLVQQGIVDLQALAIRWGTGRLTVECMVSINGSLVRARDVTNGVGARIRGGLSAVEHRIGTRWHEHQRPSDQNDDFHAPTTRRLVQMRQRRVDCVAAELGVSRDNPFRGRRSSRSGSLIALDSLITFPASSRILQ